jgi:RND family efflux transporter MFP subunit
MFSSPRASSSWSLWWLLGSLAWGLCASLPAAENKSNPALTVSRGSLRGVLRPVDSRQLSARAAGVIERFGAEEGQQVAADDLLVQLNADVERADVARAQAVVESVNGELARAQRELERTRELQKEAIGSKKDLEDAEYAHLVAVARQKQAQADLEMAKARLRERSITAPIAGMVFRRTRAVGEAVERLETVIRLVDASKLEMIVYGGPELLGKFKQGQTVRVLVETGPATESQVPGTVSYVDPTMDPDSGVFRVKIQVEPTAQVQTGITVSLQLPSEAVY